MPFFSVKKKMYPEYNMVVARLNFFKENSNQTQPQPIVVRFYIQSSHERDPVSSEFSPAFDIVTSFHFCYSHSCEVISYCVLTWISLMADDIKKLFHVLICHLYILLDKISLHAFGPFFNRIIWIFVAEFWELLYILDTGPVSDMWFASSSQSVACLFILSQSLVWSKSF